MAAVFVKLLNMSITAGWIVLAVVALRMIFKKAPKSLTCALWALVGIRLVCPFSFESILSLIPTSQTVSPVGNASQSQGITDYIPTASTETTAEVVQSGFGLSTTEILSIIWIIGIAAMLVYFAVSYIHIYKNVKVSIKIEDNIYICDDISTPFILGIIRPKIYLPSAIAERQIGCVVAHEKAHIKRRDNLWKPLGFLMLSVYWFNPLMWLAYILLCRDIELACDERVIKKMEAEDKKAYSEALFEFSAPKRMVTACPVAFAEIGVKTRIKSVLSYKKPAFWVIVTACVAVTVTIVCLMTNPIEPKTLNEKLESFISDTIIRQNYREYETGSMMDFACESHVVLDTRKQGNKMEIYCVTAYFEYNSGYVLSGFNDRIYDVSISPGVSGSITPTIISVIRNDDGSYDLLDYWEPGMGSAYTENIKLRFPIGTWKDAIGMTYNHQLAESCKQKACEYYNVPYIYEEMTVPDTTRAVTANTAAAVSLGNSPGHKR